MKIKNFRANAFIISYEIEYKYKPKIYIQYLNITFKCANIIGIYKERFSFDKLYDKEFKKYRILHIKNYKSN